ncbi:hypothetical protein [Actinomyces vulturis]|uniref:hypothetical protein n=1 Tax=Actinomyces vulturis TaxID=1857645 RepID=UPI003CCC2015
MTRRAQREAERAAEREAFLTGQQPLLTRREMKRLRDEAQALRDAVERGEITLEQAQALQNPLAPLPDVATVVAGHGVHSAATGVGDMEPIAVPVKGMSAASADSAASAVSAPSVFSADAAQGPSIFSSPETGAQGADASIQEAAEDVAALSGETPQTPDQPDDEASLDETVVVESVESVEVSAEGAGSSESAQPADNEDLELEATAPHVAIDDSTPEPEVKGEDGEAAPPRRRSLRDRFAESTRPAPALTSLTYSDELQVAAEAVGEQAAQEMGDPEEDRDPIPPVRRPVVRIPTAAHGVRTVESTGELSRVQVVGEDFTGVETPQWKAVRPENSPVVPVPAPGLSPAVASAASSPVQAVSTPTASTPEEHSEVDDSDVTHAPIESSTLRTVLILFGIIVVGLLLGALLWIFVIQPDHSALADVLPHIMACGESARSTLGLL